MRTPRYCLQQAESVGRACLALVERMFGDRVLDRLRGVQGLLRLADQFGADRLEAACQRMREADIVSVRTARLMLKKGLDRVVEPMAVIDVNGREQYLVIDNFWQIGVVVAYERAPAFGRQSRRWRISERNPLLDVLVVVRVNADRTSVRDYFVVPRPARASFPEVLQQRNERHVEAMRSDSCNLERRVGELLCTPPLHI